MPRTKLQNMFTSKNQYPKIQDKEQTQDMEKSVSTLSEGQEFKNWKELFDYLNIHYPTGNSRMSAIKHLKCWIDIEQEDKTGKLQILEVYEKPLELLDGRQGGNHSIYKKYLKTLLLNNLLLNQTIEKNFSYADFWIEMGMCNRYYTDKNTQQKIVESKNNIIDEDQMEDFFKRTWSIMRNITDSVLESLQNEGMLEFKRGRMIKKKADHPSIKASAKENKIIGSTETRILHQMGFNNKKDLFLSGKTRAFREKVKAVLKLKYGWENYYQCFDVIAYDDDILRKGIITNAEELKRELNSNVLNRVNSNTQSLFDREEERLAKAYQEMKNNIAFGSPISYKDFKMVEGYRLFTETDYVKVQQLLAELFIDNSKDLIKRIQQIEMNSNEEIE